MDLKISAVVLGGIMFGFVAEAIAHNTMGHPHNHAGCGDECAGIFTHTEIFILFITVCSPFPSGYKLNQHNKKTFFRINTHNRDSRDEARSMPGKWRCQSACWWNAFGKNNKNHLKFCIVYCFCLVVAIGRGWFLFGNPKQIECFLFFCCLVTPTRKKLRLALYLAFACCSHKNNSRCPEQNFIAHTTTCEK